MRLYERGVLRTVSFPDACKEGAGLIRAHAHAHMRICTARRWQHTGLLHALGQTDLGRTGGLRRVCAVDTASFRVRFGQRQRRKLAVDTMCGASPGGYALFPSMKGLRLTCLRTTRQNLQLLLRVCGVDQRSNHCRVA